MTAYELLIDASIRAHGLETFQTSENYYVIKASVQAGVLAALCTNFLEVVVIR